MCYQVNMSMAAHVVLMDAQQAYIHSLDKHRACIQGICTGRQLLPASCRQCCSAAKASCACCFALQARAFLTHRK